MKKEIKIRKTRHILLSIIMYTSMTGIIFTNYNANVYLDIFAAFSILFYITISWAYKLEIEDNKVVKEEDLRRIYLKGEVFPKEKDITPEEYHVLYKYRNYLMKNVQLYKKLKKEDEIYN